MSVKRKTLDEVVKIVETREYMLRMIEHCEMHCQLCLYVYQGNNIREALHVMNAHLMDSHKEEMTLNLANEIKKIMKKQNISKRR